MRSFIRADIIQNTTGASQTLETNAYISFQHTAVRILLNVGYLTLHPSSTTHMLRLINRHDQPHSNPARNSPHNNHAHRSPNRPQHVLPAPPPRINSRLAISKHIQRDRLNRNSRIERLFGFRAVHDHVREDADEAGDEVTGAERGGRFEVAGGVRRGHSVVEAHDEVCASGEGSGGEVVADVGEGGG